MESLPQNVAADKRALVLLVWVTRPTDVLVDELRNGLLKEVIEEQQALLALDVEFDSLNADAHVVKELRLESIEELRQAKPLEDLVDLVEAELFLAELGVQMRQYELLLPVEAPHLN